MSIYDVMAIYFGDWHADPDMQSLHGPNWTEWGLVTSATPRYPGHQQPNLPHDELPGWGVRAEENTPAAMRVKADRALQSGVDAFLFDWYWYAEKGTEGKGGAFLNGALDDGFLPLTAGSNATKLKFALMWANQDWVDVHPAKRGWSATGRRYPGPQDVDPEQPHRCADGSGTNKLLLQFDGFMNASVYAAAFEQTVQKYFGNPNYYKAPTTLRNGTVAMCPYYAIYQLQYLIDGVGGIANAEKVLDRFRDAAEAAGSCVHLVVMVAGKSTPASMCGAIFFRCFMFSAPGILKSVRAASTTSYCWMKLGLKVDFPTSNYSSLIPQAAAAWESYASHFKGEAGIEYAPVISVGWDSSPRTLPSDPFGEWGYPWGPSYASTPSEWEIALETAKKYLDSTCQSPPPGATAEGWCPPLVLNAWNEWSEGAYIEPDKKYGFQKLDALKRVFGGER